jgi:hypothetical protein
MNAILTLYRMLLRLFPLSFQDEFGDEMQSVFAELISDRAADSQLNSRLSLTGAVLAEIFSLPGAALRQYLATWFVQKPRPAGWEGPPTRKESLLALAVFALPVLGLFQVGDAQLSDRALAVPIAVLVLSLLVIGTARGFPRWSLPYLGLALSTACIVVIFQLEADRLYDAALSRFGLYPLDGSSRLALQALWAGLMWLGLFVISYLALGLLALLKRFNSLLFRIRQDWTLVSYIFYSGALAAFTLSFTQRHHERLFAVASILCLAAGAWLYLRSPRPWQRSFALLSGITLAVLASAAGQWPLIPVHAWLDRASWPGLEGDAPFGISSTILEWSWMAAAILAPALLQSIPRPGKPHSASP